jgi:hypothetical protein
VVSKRRTPATEVHTITSTRAPLGDDIARRARRYMLQMSLRTLCFLGAVFTWGRVPTPVSVALLIGAVVLPYVAVVLANAGRERPEQADPFLEITRQLGPGTLPVSGAPQSAPPRWDDAHARWVPDDPAPWQPEDRTPRQPEDRTPRQPEDRTPRQHDERMRPDGTHGTPGTPSDGRHRG